MRTRQAWLTRTGEGGFGLADCIRQGVVALKAIDPANAFEREVQIGDIVVTPHTHERRIFFGEVTGEYLNTEPGPVPDLPHTRTVRWLGDLPRDKIPADRRKELDLPSTFYLLASNAEWLDQATAATSDSLRAPKQGLKPAAARAKLPKPVEAATAKCTVCNMTVTPTDVVDGVCDFCR